MKNIVKLSLLTCIVTLSLGQFAAISKSIDSNLYLFDICQLIFICSSLTYFLFIKRSLKVPRYFILFLSFTCVAGVSLLPKIGILPMESLLTASFYWVRWTGYLISALFVYNCILNKIISVRELAISFILSCLFISIIGFIQLIILPDFEVLDPSLGWDPHKNRLVSVFFDPNFTGIYLCLGLVLLFEVLVPHNLLVELKFQPVSSPNLVDVKKSLNSFSLESRVAVFISYLIMLLALFLTFSRSSWLTLAIIILIYGLFRSRLLLLLAILIAFLSYFAVPRVQTRLAGITDPADSAQFRLISWKNAWTIAQDNFLFGVGFNAFRYAQYDYGFFDAGTVGGHAGAGSDSGFLLILATTGVIGFILFTLGYLYPLFEVYIIKKSTNYILLASIVGILVHTQFVNSLFFPQVLFVWLTMLAGFNAVCDAR